MTAISALAIMMALPAYADTAVTDVSGKSATPPAFAKDGSVMDDVKSDLHKAGNEISDTASDIKAFFIGKEADHKLEPVLIRRSSTAHGLIGKTIINAKGKKIATVKDIIINKDGKASMVVVSDAGLLGIGTKVAAFDYNKVVAQKPDGKVFMPLSQDMVDRAVDFSYDQKDWAKAKIIPAGSISTNVLLQGDVLNNAGAKVATIENIYFRNAEVSQIIVSFNKTLGMGGDLAALDYDDLQMVRHDQSLDFKLTENQTLQFKNFNKSVSN